MQTNDKRPSEDMTSAQKALKDAHRLLEEGRELRREVSKRLEPITRISEKDLRFRLR